MLRIASYPYAEYRLVGVARPAESWRCFGAAQDVDVSTNRKMDTSGTRRTNKYWPETLKREIVAATFAPGASVSVVARRYDVNVNQVFGWRRRLGPPMATVAVASPSPRPRLVEVTLAPEPAGPPLASAARVCCDLIEIEVGGT